MKTKCIIIGNINLHSNLKPIVFTHKLLSTLEIVGTTQSPSQFKYLELISKYSEYNDLIFGYNNPEIRSAGILFIGHWGDGIVE